MKNRSLILSLRFLSLILIAGSLWYGIKTGEASMLWFFGLGVFLLTVSIIIEEK